MDDVQHEIYKIYDGRTPTVSQKTLAMGILLHNYLLVVLATSKYLHFIFFLLPLTLSNTCDFDQSEHVLYKALSEA